MFWRATQSASRVKVSTVQIELETTELRRNETQIETVSSDASCHPRVVPLGPASVLRVKRVKVNTLEIPRRVHTGDPFPLSSTRFQHVCFRTPPKNHSTWPTPSAPVFFRSEREREREISNFFRHFSKPERSRARADALERGKLRVTHGT